MKRQPLKDKVVLVTGAGRGLGAATAARLAARGARVVVLDLDLVAAQAVVAELPPGRALAVSADVTDAPAVHRAVEQVVEHFGQLDVVVANAGVLGRTATLRALSRDAVDAVMDVNVGGVLNTVHASLEHLIRARGRIVLISSVFAFINGAGAIPYAMSKAAVEQLGRALRVELTGHGVSVTLAYFSLIDTDMLRTAFDDPQAHSLVKASPRLLLKRVSPATAARLLTRAVEHRRRSVIVPARWRPVAGLRGILMPAFDTRLAGDPQVQSLFPDLDRR